MTIAIDFDGTCVTHEYPNIGKDIGAVEVLKTLVANGHKLILHTMRGGPHLDQAVLWLNSKGVELYGVNNNPAQKNWTISPKIFANLYIDDAALGIPLIKSLDKPYIDWVKVTLELVRLGCIMPEEAGKLIPEILNIQNDLELFQ